MRPINWLHISDFHIRSSDNWSRDVVLKATCDSIGREIEKIEKVDFILATGDLAYSGSREEYRLAANFFDAISSASGVPKARIFCIPGNHDVDRECQKMAFLGARSYLENQNRVDLILSPGDDLEALLKRQENYQNFQDSYFAGQARTPSDTKLGYAACITIDDVRLAIIGLNSAWMAEGDVGDHGRLIIGERQVISALDLAAKFDPHVVIGMAHHPFHMLQEFDIRAVRSRIEQQCHFFHCGHLHEPEARNAGYGGGGCLTLTAGASFETRQSHNTYSLVTLDLLRAQRIVTVFQYTPIAGAFTYSSSKEFRIEITSSGKCRADELAEAMMAYRSLLRPYVHYLSALLLDQKADVPIPIPTGYTYGSFAILENQPDSELRRKTIDFMGFKNVLRVFYKRLPLSEIFARYGEVIEKYGAYLLQICNESPALKSRVAEYDRDSQAMADEKAQGSFVHTRTLLDQLAADKEWIMLQAQSERHMSSEDQKIAVYAKRMLALALANSEELADKKCAIDLYRSLISGEFSEASDFGNLATLLIDLRESPSEVKNVVRNGFSRFPIRTDYFFQIGLKLVELTGDRMFRKEIENVRAGKSA